MSEVEWEQSTVNQTSSTVIDERYQVTVEYDGDLYIATILDLQRGGFELPHLEFDFEDDFGEKEKIKVEELVLSAIDAYEDDEYDVDEEDLSNWSEESWDD